MSLLADAAAVEFGAKEPWPDNVCLYQPYEVGQVLLPEYASCLSVKCFLKMCGLKFKVELRTNAEQMSPSGKVPFIQIGPLLISETDPIMGYVNTKGHHLSGHLSDMEQAEMKAYIALVENVLANSMLYLSWCEKTIRDEVTRGRYGSPYPWPLNILLPLKKQWEMTGLLKATGWAQKSFEEVCDEVETCCQALSERLGNNKYFFGEKATEVDAVVFGHLFTLLTTTLPINTVATIVQNFPNLVRFCQDIDNIYFKTQDT